MPENHCADLILTDLMPVWDISGILIDRGLKIKYGHIDDIFHSPEFVNTIKHNDLNGTLEELKCFPTSFYSWLDRSIFINVPEYLKQRANGYNAPVHEIGHACHHLVSAGHPQLAGQITLLYEARKEQNKFIDHYSAANGKEFFAQSFMHYHNRKLSLHPVVRTNWELKIFDGELFHFISEVLKTVKNYKETTASLIKPLNYACGHSSGRVTRPGKISC